MLKECWNQKKAPADFSDQLFNGQISEIDRKKIIDDLFTYCGQEEDSSLLFLQYLEIIITKIPEKIAEYYNDPASDHCTAILKLILHCGTSFFEAFSLEEEYSVNFAVQILIIIIEASSIDALKILSDNVIFDVLIAKAKFLFPDSIKNICEDFPKEKFIQVFGPAIPYPRTLLCNALYSQNITEPFLLTNHQVIRSILPSISTVNGIQMMLRFTEKKTFYHLYMQIVSDFLLKPSLLNAYFITNLFPRMEPSLGRDLQMDKVSEFNPESIIHIIDECAKELKDEDFMNEHSPRENCDFLFSADQLGSIKRLLTTMPDEVDPSSIVEQCLEYPALSIRLFEHITIAIAAGDAEQTANYANQILNRHVDFVTLLLQQNKYFDFLTELINLVYSIYDKLQFGSCWILLLTAIRDAWGIGWQKLNDDIYAFITSITNDAMRYFLLILINKEPEETPLPKVPKTPFLETVHLFQDLFYGEVDLESSIQKLIGKPYYAPSILLYCLRNPQPMMRQPWTVKPENFQLNNLFFYHLMIKTSSQTNAWTAGIEMPDYELLIQEAPKDISLLNPILARYFDQLISLDPDSSLFLDIVCCWRAWAKSFGLSAFVKQLFEQLIWKASRIGVEVDVEAIFQSVSYIMTVLCNNDVGMIEEVLTNVEIFIDDGDKGNTFSEAISRFVVILICGASGNWESLFDAVIEKCINFINEGKSPSKIKFALSILRMSIGNKLLSKRLGPQVETALRSMSEWQTLVDYFSMKAWNQQHEANE